VFIRFWSLRLLMLQNYIGCQILSSLWIKVICFN